MEKKSIGLYNFVDDKLLNNNQVGKLPAIQNSMEKQVKAFIQQYNNRMLDDKLNISKISIFCINSLNLQ